MIEMRKHFGMAAARSLTLSSLDPAVIAATQAERRLYEHYGKSYEARHFTIKSLGIKARLCMFGDGPPVLIVPGNTGDSFPFAPLIAQLSGYRLIALNLPGGGLSEGMDHRTIPYRALANETLGAVLDHLALDSVPIVSHSMGSHRSLWFAVDQSERVERLVLLGSPGNALDCRPPLALRLTSVPWVNRSVFLSAIPRSTGQALRGLSLMGHSQRTCSALPLELAECYYRFQRLPHYRVSALSLMEATCSLFGSKPQVRIREDDLRKVHQPTLLIWGSNDPFGSVGKGKEVASCIEDSRFTALDGAGHLPWLDEPALCAEKIRAFLSTTRAP
jgi:pimeloyl-ACP methyl ester carboxylesterase